MKKIKSKSNPNPKIQIQLLGHWMHHFGHLEPHTISNQQRPIMKKTEKIQSKSNSKFWNQQRSIMKKQNKSNPNPTFGINKGQL